MVGLLVEASVRIYPEHANVKWSRLAGEITRAPADTGDNGPAPRPYWPAAMPAPDGPPAAALPAGRVSRPALRPHSRSFDHRPFLITLTPAPEKPVLTSSPCVCGASLGRNSGAEREKCAWWGGLRLREAG